MGCMDVEGFHAPNLGTAGLRHAIRLALARAHRSAADIGLLIWAPQGNRQDLKVLRAGEEIPALARLPLVTTTFNTGYIESASILVSVAAVLAALASGAGLWPQRTGLPELDQRPVSATPECLLALASTDLGYNYAVVFRRGWNL